MSHLYRIWLLLIFAACALVCLPSASAQVAGQNVNMVSGTKWPGGDPFLQRQNEPSMAVSTRNPMHILAGANDYRTVDLETVLSEGEETGDAWLGLFKSFDGGLTWRSTLLPGCPYPDPQCTDSGALRGTYQAGADPVVRAGTNGMFFYAGLAFDRATTSTSASSVSTIFVARYNDLNNNENVDPITYIDTHIVASGNGSQFLDKPAMAVDIPRSGANTCSFTAQEPGVGPNGGTLAVHQSFAAGNVYLTYTDFLQGNKDNSTPTHLMFTRSTDCGVTWSTPIQLNTGNTTSQGSAIAVNALNGNVYVTWRQFKSTGFPDAILTAVSTNAGRSFATPVSVSTFTPFDQGTTGTSFRTNAYPSITTDLFGFVYIAFSAKGLVASGDARVVAAGSLDGTHYSPAIMVDNPAKNATSNPSGRGHQIMPAITFANGRLTLLYYDLRLDHYQNNYTSNPASPTGYNATLTAEGELAGSTPNLSKVFTPFIDDFGLTLRRHTLDMRVLQLGIFPTVTLGPSVLVSQYAYGCCVTPTMPDIEQFKFNVPNLPIFSQGEVPFLGDYIDVVPSPAFVPNGSSWAYNFTPSVNPLFHATWTDNRDVVPPADGIWTHYTPPVPAGTTSVFQPGQPVFCTPGQEGMRNQNIYTAQITGGLIVGAPGNSKPLGTTVFNGKTVPFQRAFAVEAQNATSSQINVRFTIANQPTGGQASFMQFSQLTTLDVSIPALSSVSRSVFVTSTNAQATVTVNVVQIGSIGGSPTTNGLSQSAVLNPDLTNPNITNPNITNPNVTNPNITNFEVTNPNITNPNITNPNITNPNITNPNITNPNITNPNVTNPNVTNVSATNPNVTNPNITNPDVTNPNITNPNITNPNVTNGSIEDVIYPITNNGNTTATYTVQVAASQNLPTGLLLQLILDKLYQTPVAVSCQLTTETHWETVANIVNPKLYALTDPKLGNPNITNSVPNEASITLAPGETAFIDFRVISTTGSPITINPLNFVTPVTTPQAVNTQTALANPGGVASPVTVPPLAIVTTTLPDAVVGHAYSATLFGQGGNPGPYIWSVPPGTLPAGLTLNAATGTISGTPAVPGTFPFAIQLKDTAIGTQFPQHTTNPPTNFTIHVASPVSLNPGALVGTTPLTGGTQGTAYNQTILPVGGLPPVTISLTSGQASLPAGLSFSNGAITGTPSGTGLSTFTVRATDSSNPAQIFNSTYSINIVSSAPAAGFVTFLAQPQSSKGGQVLTGSPVSVTVTDVTGAVIPNAHVAMTFNGAPACTGALLSGTLTQTTGPTGVASFPDLSVDRGQNGYTLRATVVGTTVFGNSSAFNVSGFCDTGNMITARRNQLVIALPNGKILVAGGLANADGTGALASAEVYDPVLHTFSATANPMTAPRFDQTLTLLPNGKVLVAGGYSNTNPTTVLSSAELFDPGSNTFTAIPAPMTTTRTDHTATLLANGKVLLAGGNDNSGNALATAEIYDPANNTFTATSHTMNSVRQIHHADLLPNGKVLVSGGYNTSNVELASAEIYDPVADTFTPTGSMTTARGNHASALLYTGKVLVAGGTTAGARTATAELYDPATGLFTTTASMSVPRGHYAGIVLNDGTIFISGGAQLPAGINADVYSPATQTFSVTGNFTMVQTGEREGLAPDGTVLLASGVNNAVPAVTVPNSELFYPVPLAPGIVITTPTVLPGASQNQPFTQVLLEHGGAGQLTWHSTSLPAGLALSSSGILTGSPTGSGPFTIPVTLTDSSVPPQTASTSFTLTVAAAAPPLAITTTTLPDAPTQNGAPVGTSAVHYSAQVLTTGGAGGATTFSIISGALPPSMALDPATGAITSNNVTETANTSYSFTIQAVSAGPPSATATKALSITIRALFFGNTSPTLPSGTVGSPYSTTISSGGGFPPITYSLASGTTPPPGLTLTTGSPSATLSGTPTATETSYTFNVQASDSSVPAQSYVQPFTITIGAPPLPIVTFASQPPNYVGGQTSPNSPVQVHVTDSMGAAIGNANVTMSFNGTPPCAAAVLGGTLMQQTSGTGDAFFGDLSVDRGQIGYSLRASVSGPTASATSNPFTVNGFCATGNSGISRSNPTATLLPSGAVLVAGGQVDQGPAATAFAELYNSSNGTFTATVTTMTTQRLGHTATLLNNGTVLIVGGQQLTVDGVFYLNTAEIYDPASGTFTSTSGSLAAARASHTATLLADGTVLIVGGFNGSALNSAELYDPVAKTFTTVGPMNAARYTHTATLLPNGKVLVATGLDNSAQLYDPVAKTFSNTGSVGTSRQSPSATLLPNGQVLIAGGLINGSAGIKTAELYDPVAGTFSFTGNLNAARGAHTATLLTDGTVLIAGGFDVGVNPDILASAEIYNPSFSTFAFTGSLTGMRWEHTATLLNDGSVLIAGGFGSGFLATADRYFSTAPLSPMAFTTPTTLAAGQPATSVFSNSTAFNGAATNLTPVGFSGILNGANNLDFNPLTVSTINFSTPTDGTFVNVTKSTFYTPKNYPADFIIDSSNPSPSNELVITLPQPTRALGLDYGGFSGASSATLTLSNGFTLPLASLPALGNTQFSGFVSATPFSTLTFTTTNDSWVVLDLLLGTANTALPSATEAIPYTQILLEQGGVGPLTWSLANGTQSPTGLNLNSKGILTGTPTASGIYTFAVKLMDSSNPPKTVTSGNLTMSIVPQPPSNVSPGAVSPSSATIIWEFSLSTDVTGYNIYRANTSGGPYTKVGSAIPTAFSFIDNTVQSGTTYYYVVTAAGNGGVESVNSNQATVVVP